VLAVWHFWEVLILASSLVLGIVGICSGGDFVVVVGKLRMKEDSKQ